MEGILREGLKASAAPTRARIAAAVLNIGKSRNPTSASPRASALTAVDGPPPSHCHRVRVTGQRGAAQGEGDGQLIFAMSDSDGGWEYSDDEAMEDFEVNFPSRSWAALRLSQLRR